MLASSFSVSADTLFPSDERLLPRAFLAVDEKKASKVRFLELKAMLIVILGVFLSLFNRERRN